MILFQWEQDCEYFLISSLAQAGRWGCRGKQMENKSDVLNIHQLGGIIVSQSSPINKDMLKGRRKEKKEGEKGEKSLNSPTSMPATH